MSTTFYIAPTDLTPEVDLDAQALRFCITGRSLPENSEAFYEPMLEWVKQTFTNTPAKATFDLKLDYYNTGSFIRIMELFNLLAELNDNGCYLSVRWICEAEDEDTIADGESFKEVVKIPFDIIEI